jgi:two-component system cell cycle sensor histidine kinase/response regulator CckA
LGLATVYGIVKQHLGWIEVTSQLNQGTTFRVMLPASRNAKPVLGGSRSSDPKRDSILLVEDEPAVLELMGRLLADQGHRVLQASSGIEAMQIWSEHPVDIKLLLTDVRMPSGMSGYEVAENLLALNPSLRVIFVSGYATESLRQEQLIGRGTLFLSKPCPPGVLRDAVDGLLASSNN